MVSGKNVLLKTICLEVYLIKPRKIPFFSSLDFMSLAFFVSLLNSMFTFLESEFHDFQECLEAFNNQKKKVLLLFGCGPGRGTSSNVLICDAHIDELQRIVSGNYEVSFCCVGPHYSCLPGLPVNLPKIFCNSISLSACHLLMPKSIIDEKHSG